jgi:sterol desaturase/sphingolipid hydroxylase (fatty acid hydroxylase superfamily)
MEDALTLALLGGFALLLALDHFAPARKFPTVKRWRLKGLLMFVVSLGLFSTLPFVWDEWLGQFRLIDATKLPVALGALLAVAVAQLFSYGWHRAMHRVPLLWRLHRVHHEAGPLCWTTAWVLHPLDAILNASASVVGAALLGAGLPAAAWFVVGRRIWTIVLHANIRWPASALDGFFATPAFHARHHREDLAAVNFAPTLPVIDRMFGTYRSLR